MAVAGRLSPPHPQFRLRLGPIATAAFSAVLGACAMVPPAPRADVPPVGARVSVQAIAGQVSVVGQRGRLGRGERETLLRRLSEQGSGSLVQRHLAAMSGFGEVDLYAGNEARLLIDGPATFDAMFKAIDSARKSILLESYIIENVDIAQRLAALLAKKRADGVAVAMLYDAVGSLGTEGSYFDGLRSAGVLVCAFNPLNPLKRTGYWDISHRDHRKILAVDREIGFTGGINISAVYSAGSFSRSRRSAKTGEPEAGWRDTQVQVTGPAVAALDDLVREAWQQQHCGGELPALPPKAMPAARSSGQQVMRIIPSTPEDELNRIYALLLTAIDASQRSVFLTMAYFAPGQDMLDALCDAAGRGVDVQLVLPSMSDFSPVLHAGRSYYDRLLAAGVKIHELQDAVLHAKTAVIDGVVSTVGSSNMDWRSFTSNSEVNAVVIGEDFGATMTRMFQGDIAASQAITLAQWRDRSLWQRSKESLARLFERWW